MAGPRAPLHRPHSLASVGRSWATPTSVRPTGPGSAWLGHVHPYISPSHWPWQGIAGPRAPLHQPLPLALAGHSWATSVTPTSRTRRPQHYATAGCCQVITCCWLILSITHCGPDGLRDPMGHSGVGHCRQGGVLGPRTPTVRHYHRLYARGRALTMTYGASTGLLQFLLPRK